MDIFQVLQSVDNPSAGPTYSVGFLSHYLTARKHHVTVVALGPPPSQWPYRSSLKGFGGLASKVGLASMEPVRFVTTTRATRPGIIHGHGLWRMANIFPLLLRRTAPTKIVWSPRGMLSTWSWNHKAMRKRPFWHALQRPALDKVHCFHATAESEVEDIRRLGFHQPVALIPNGVDIPDHASSNERSKTVLFLSRIHEKKGLHLLIPVWREIASEFPAWNIQIAGRIDSAYGRRMVNLAEELNVPRLKFIGETLGVEKTQLFVSARLFVLPTFSENFGMAIAEALAHAVPVITTVETPWREIDQRGCGWCIHPNENDLKRVLRVAMHCSDERLTEMGEAGRVWMNENYSWVAIARMFEKLYLWLLKAEEKPPFVYC